MKKALSILLTIFMLTSISAYAVDNFVAPNSNGVLTYYSSINEVWDISVDNTYTVGENGGYLYKNSVALILDASKKEFADTGNMGSDNAQLNVGASNLNKVFISNDETVANDDHDYFIKIQTTTEGVSEECQLNQLPIRANKGITVVQNDFCLDAVPVGDDAYVRVQALQHNDGSLNSYNTNGANTVFRVSAGGVLHAGSKKTDITINARQWYTATQVVNHAQGRVDYYIDGEYLHSDVNERYSALWKMTVYHPKNSEAAITYVDNIKVFKATTDKMALTKEANVVTTAEGAPVTLNVSNFVEDVIKDVKIYSSTDGANYALYSEDLSTVAYYKPYTTYYRAVGYDADGNFVFETEPVVLTTNNTKANGITYWNIDFEEGYTLSGGTKGGTIRYNGTDITNPNGKVISTNAGGDGIVKIDTVSDITSNTNGRSLVLDNTDNLGEQVQLNELRMASTDSIMVAEFDFAYNTAPESLNSVFRFEGVPYETGDTSRDFESASMLYLNKNNVLYMNTLGESTGITVSPYTWYHIVQVINLPGQVIETYVDGKLLGTAAMKGKTVDGETVFWKQIRRFSAASNSTCTNAMYYDNFNIYSVAPSAQATLKIDSINYYINGEEADKIASGSLTADVILSNNNAENVNLQCIAAVYSAPGELERVTLTPVTFTADEVSKLLNLNIGEVSETDSVKIFFWSMGENTLTPNGANGVLANE